MKKLIFVAIAISSISNSFAFNFNCGIQPTPPIGCSGYGAVCQCSSDGRNCSWQFNCNDNDKGGIGVYDPRSNPVSEFLDGYKKGQDILYRE